MKQRRERKEKREEGRRDGREEEGREGRKERESVDLQTSSVSSFFMEESSSFCCTRSALVETAHKT